MATNTPQGLVFNPNPNFQYFPPEYFGGCDVHLFMNGQWVDEITSMALVVQTNAMPLYGYASLSPDRIHVGTTLVTGQFAMNKRGAYNIKDLIAVSKVTTGDYDLINPLVDVYNPDTVNAIELTTVTEAQALRAQLEGVYWPVPKAPESQLWSTDVAAMNEQDIAIVYGRVNDYDDLLNIPRSMFHSITIIKGMRINGVSELMDSTGQPIADNFSFIAKDIVFDHDPSKV